MNKIKLIRKLANLDNKRKNYDRNYLDTIDRIIKDDNNFLDTLLYLSKYPIISIGEIGRILQIKSKQIEIVAPSHISKKRKIDLSYHYNIIKGKNFTIIDDSCYSGKTIDNIKTEVERLGGKVNQIIVGYNREKVINNIESLVTHTDLLKQRGLI